MFSIPEPFLESMPSVHIFFCLWILQPRLIFDRNPMLFWVTLSSSVFSATLGIAKSLKSGPCRLVPDQGFLNGFGQVGFVLLVINIASTILSKGQCSQLSNFATFL